MRWKPGFYRAESQPRVSMEPIVAKIRDDAWARATRLLLWQSPNRQLVYAQMAKCACTYFGQFFKQNKWLPIEIEQVQWHQQTVFGLMMEPRRRHVKGLVEDISARGWTMDELMPVLRYSYPCLGLHGLGYYQAYGDRTEQIIWLPLDITQKFQKYLNEFLLNHKQNLNWNVVITNTNASDLHKKSLFDKLWRKFPGERQSWYEIEYAKDVELWQKLNDKP